MDLSRIKWRTASYSSGPALAFAPGRWWAFTRAVKNDRATR